MRRSLCRLFFCWTLPALLLPFAASAQTTAPPALVIPLQPVPVPLPPGERSISRLVRGRDGILYGLVPSGRGWKIIRLQYTPSPEGTPSVQVSIVPAVPGLTLPPANLMSQPHLAWAWDEPRTIGYVLAADGHLWTYGADGKVEDKGLVAGTRPFEEKPPGYELSNVLVLTPAGTCLTAGDGGHLFRYQPGAPRVEKLPVRLPAVVGREPWATLDSAVWSAEGTLYGATRDGYLFTYNPVGGALVNLGKPLRAQHMPGLFWRNSVLYGVGGGPIDLPRVWGYDPRTRGFLLGGLLTHGLAQRQLNFYEPVGAAADDATGNIFIATTGRLAELYLWAQADAG